VCNDDLGLLETTCLTQPTDSEQLAEALWTAFARTASFSQKSDQASVRTRIDHFSCRREPVGKCPRTQLERQDRGARRTSTGQGGRMVKLGMPLEAYPIPQICFWRASEIW
jgi:hypothetical protein